MVIKVVGVGGGACNAVDRMLDTCVTGVGFWALNTDAQALGRSKAKGARVLNIGSAATRGLGASGNPDVGKFCGRLPLLTKGVMAICYGVAYVGSWVNWNGGKYLNL